MNGEITVNRSRAEACRTSLKTLREEISKTIGDISDSRMPMSDGKTYESLEELRSELIDAGTELIGLVDRTDAAIDGAVKRFEQTDARIAVEYGRSF